MKVEMLPVESLKPYPGNPKAHPEGQVKKLAGAIAEFKWDQPIVVDKDLVVIKGHRPDFYGERNQTTVWEIDGIGQAERKELGHATPKPVALFTRPLENHTKPGDICYEPFAGSGPQFIAAEQLGRICYGMEIAPEYVAVTLERAAGLGLEPELLTA